MDHPSLELTLRNVFHRFRHHLFSISGRASRSEYFMECLILYAYSTAVYLVLFAGMFLFGIPDLYVQSWRDIISLSAVQTVCMAAFIIWTVVALAIGMCLIARRYHDTGRSAWWLLIYPLTVLPLVNFIVIALQFYWTVRVSASDNQYGPQPPETLGAPQLKFTQAFWQFCHHPLRFSGRLSRQEYWLQVSALWTAWFIVYLLSYIPILLSMVLKPLPFIVTFFICAIMVTLLIAFICSFSLAARRIHDMGHSGWWVLLPILILPISCIPFIGGAAVGIFFIGWTAWLCGLSAAPDKEISIPARGENISREGPTNAVNRTGT